jgi:hypothetical protein
VPIRRPRKAAPGLHRRVSERAECLIDSPDRRNAARPASGVGAEEACLFVSTVSITPVLVGRPRDSGQLVRAWPRPARWTSQEVPGIFTARSSGPGRCRGRRGRAAPCPRRRERPPWRGDRPLLEGLDGAPQQGLGGVGVTLARVRWIWSRPPEALQGHGVVGQRGGRARVALPVPLRLCHGRAQGALGVRPAVLARGGARAPPERRRRRCLREGGTGRDERRERRGHARDEGVEPARDDDVTHDRLNI